MAQKNTITISGKDYVLDDLSEKAKAQVLNLRVVGEEIQKLEQRLSIYKTARAAYARVLQEELEGNNGSSASRAH